MNKYLPFLISILWLSCTIDILAQTYEVSLSGKVSPKVIESYGSRELMIRIIETANEQSQGKVISVPILQDGSFKTKLNLSDSLEYFALEMRNVHHQNRSINVSSIEYKRKLDEIYLFQKGDSINVNIGPGGLLTFQGKGSEKLNCQWQIYNIEPLSKGILYRSNRFIASKELEKKLLFEDRAVDLAIQMRLEILKSYQAQIPSQVYNLLYLDAIAGAVYAILKPLHWMQVFFPGKETIGIVQRYYNDYLKKKQEIKIDGSTKAQSGYYADMLFEQEYNYFKLNSKNGSVHRSDSFQEVYERLKDRYEGKLRDKLIFICFEKLGRSFMVESKTFVPDALNSIKDQKFKTLLNNWKDRQYMAYPFQLIDVQGRLHHLNDFSGKVLIIDFWYTGCPNCITLNAAMHPIVELYRDHKEVVFISVSIDKDKDQWQQSISSGKYTHKGNLNLYTNGMGTNHPLIENYNIIAYPRQLIINKRGELITSSPPRVDGGPSNLKEFKAIIETALND